MAFSQTSMIGMKIIGRTSGGEEFLLPGDPGVTFTRGEHYSLSGGVLIASTDSLAGPDFVCTRGVVCPAASQVFPKPRDQYYAGFNDAVDKTLVPVQWTGNVAGRPVYAAKLANYQDETVVSYTASTRAVAMTTGFGADDRPNGGLAYVYEGPGIGEMNIIEDYDHAGGAAELLAIFHRAFATTLTTSSKMIVLSATAGANAVGPFGRLDISDTDQLDCNDGVDDGQYMVYGDWSFIGHQLAKGWVPVINIGHGAAL